MCIKTERMAHMTVFPLHLFISDPRSTFTSNFEHRSNTTAINVQLLATKMLKAQKALFLHPMKSDGDRQVLLSINALIISQPVNFLSGLSPIPASKYPFKHYGPPIYPPEFCSPWRTPPPRLCSSLRCSLTPPRCC